MEFYALFCSAFSTKSLLNDLYRRFNLSKSKGQSAIEYLTTYGWMLLVVAIVGGTIFSVIQGQGIQEVTGFSSGGIAVEQSGITPDNNLDLVMRNVEPEEITISRITVSNGQRESYYLMGERSIRAAGTELLTVN